VLNLQGGGRPARIVRKRLPQAWEEEWQYEDRSGEARQLRFHNGQLTAVDVLTAPERFASGGEGDPANRALR